MSIANFTTIETTRLRLRHFTDSDLPAFIGYRNDAVVAKYQSWEGISEPEAYAFIQEQKETQLGVPGQGMQIAIEFKETGMLVGDCYFTINEHDERQAEIGYTLSRACQGQGFATEAIACLLTYAFVTFNLHRIIAITDCENAASVALLERLGMRCEGHFLQNVWFKGKWGNEYLYAIASTHMHEAGSGALGLLTACSLWQLVVNKAKVRTNLPQSLEWRLKARTRRNCFASYRF